VTVESNGEEALARIQGGERFDMILCDVMMPQMTGLELFDLVSALSPDQAKRIVFITGGAFTGGIQRVLEATGNPRLDKPFHAERLRDLVGEILDARRSVEAGMTAPAVEPHTAPVAASSAPPTRVSARRGSLSPVAQGKRRDRSLRH